ncbi:NACHT, LRR and PYD domains-containing protein 3-like isoform X2 [Dysidea avara]|uniref:NACHT, LRR and PYD domains-containing protein 3-like isoform X2 n=1 Tax=Dysidea avara TaxID=196820 RepID=UPI00332412B6
MCIEVSPAVMICGANGLRWTPLLVGRSCLKLLSHLQCPVIKLLIKSTVTDQGVTILSDRVRQLSIQTRFSVDEDAWPPNRPKDFIPVLLIHHQGEHTVEQAAALQLAESVQLGGVHPKHYPQDSHQSLREALDNSKTTKQLVDILAPLQESDDAHLILVEGLPGIGKSLLLQEIAYQWSIGKLLQKFKIVFFLQLRSPAVQQVSLVADLFKLVCEGDEKAPRIAIASSDYFFENKGEGLVFLFDGFDEFPEHLQKDSLIASILKRKVLPHCGLVVSSRPHASVGLREDATIRVDILGFAEDERKLYIEQSLKEQPHAVKELTEYLEGNLTINGLCFIPFNMVILIYLYKKRIPLPSNSTQLYNYFICLTICRHLAKSGQPLDNTITDLAKLPQPCNIIVQQLSKLSLEGLNNNKLIFTSEEMRAACPGFEAIEGALNGFGLLQAVKHFGLAGKTMTFNFVHYSIQEFLSAYHITQLPPDEELRVLEAKFWSDIHSNMFAMYTSLTKGRRSAFKQFLSGGDDTITIAETYLKDQLKCLRLFRCFYEANDEAFYTSIQQGKTFDDKVINLEKTSLTVYDVECVTLFLTCSPHKEWKKLNLSRCHIQDHGCRVLHRDLMSSDVNIKELYLGTNGFTRSSSSSISDLIIYCRVEVLDISSNHTIGEDPALYNMLTHPSSRLVTLHMIGTSLSSPSAITLFTAISKGNKLKELHIYNNLITDEACDVIATTMKNNTSLVLLGMSGNKISGEAAQHLLQALNNNDTLEVLWLPFGYTEDVEKRIRSLQEVINKNRESRGCQTKLITNCQ